MAVMSVTKFHETVFCPYCTTSIEVMIPATKKGYQMVFCNNTDGPGNPGCGNPFVVHHNLVLGKDARKIEGIEHDPS